MKGSTMQLEKYLGNDIARNVIDHAVPWLPSQADVLAEDWEVVA